jgi:hypothetical protein
MKLFCDLKTDDEKANFFLSGRAHETGVISKAIQNDVAMAYQRCAGYQEEVEQLRTVTITLQKALEECRFALEPYDDIKPRDWLTDRRNLRRAHEAAVAAFAAIAKSRGEE